MHRPSKVDRYKKEEEGRGRMGRVGEKMREREGWRDGPNRVCTYRRRRSLERETTKPTHMDTC